MRALFALGLALFGLGFLPLLGGPRYEAALLAGLLGPSFVAIVSARQSLQRLGAVREAVASDSIARSVPLSALVLQGQRLAWAASMVVAVVALIHGLLGGFCEPLPGFALLLLGPGMGMCLGALVGVLCAVLLHLVLHQPPRLRWAALALLGPLGSALIALGRFYNTPTVFAYDQFAGYFAGPIYDAVNYELARLLSFRVGTLSWLLAALAASSALELRAPDVGVLTLSWRPASSARSSGYSVRPPAPSATSQQAAADGSLGQRPKSSAARWSRLRDWRLAQAGLGLICAAVGVVIFVHGPELGHRATAESIQTALGRRAERGPCHVYFGAAVTADAAMSVAYECVGHLKQHGQYFAVAPPERVDVYLFSDIEEKRRFMGAARTNIAKPWRREVYITDEGFPHSILGHELAHVVTGAFGVGPLLVAGPLHGLIMDPGRVEGFAEAAALREDSFGTLQEWAAAMKKVERLPALQDVFQLGFWSTSASRSYTTAGAFVSFLHDKYGPDILKAWYAGDSLTRLTNQSWLELEAAWHAVLDEQEISPEVLSAAAPRFSRPGVLERRCPHAVDRKLGEFAVACLTQEARARRLVDEILALDPSQLGLRLECPRCVAYAGKDGRAVDEMRKLLELEQSFEPHEKRRAFEFLGDALWSLGRDEEAQHAYEQAQSLNYDPAGGRQLEVKLWALKSGGTDKLALRRLFLEQDKPDWSAQGALFDWVQHKPKDSLAYYLLARQAMALRRWEEARAWLAEVQVDQLPLASVKKEAAKMRLILACQRARRSVENAAEQAGGQVEVKAVDSRKVSAVRLAVDAYAATQPLAAELIHMQRFAARCEVTP